MGKKEQLEKVQFWIGPDLKKELIEFAHSINLSQGDLYKAGAILLKNVLLQSGDVTVNLFTRSFKDLEQKEMRKKIQKAYQGSRSTY